MEKKEIYRRHQALEQEISVYAGDDPLKLRYDFISWLDGNYGRENVMETFVPVLEDTLKSFWNAVKYQQDVRFIQLLTTYINMQKNPVEMYKSVFDRGTGTESALFYTSWANAFVEIENYKKADEIFNLGLSKLKSKTELKAAYEHFLMSLGKKYLHLWKTNAWETVCPKCCENQKSESAQGLSSGSGEVQRWEMNPLKIGEKDDFKCPMFVEDPPDPSKIPMYPKHLVYKDGKEYSLEEVRATVFMEKYKDKDCEKPEDVYNNNDLSKKMTENKSDNNCEKEFSKENMNQENVLMSRQADPCHTSPPNNPVFTKPILLHDSLTVSQTSYTAHMKEAMNVVQEMWSSPTPAVPTMASATRGRSLFSTNADPVKEAPSTNENIAASVPKKSIPFSVYTEEEEENQPKRYVPTPLGAAKTGITKAMTSIKKDPLQLKENAAGFNVLSERKPKGDYEVQEPLVRPSLLPRGKQLPFSNVVHEDNHGEVLAMKLGDISIDNANKQPTRITTVVKTLLPADQDDLTDVTCNTRAFNFSLPSSTPIQNKKFPGIRNSIDSQSSEVLTQTKLSKNPGDLSMILEASKERCSSSSSSNNGLKGQSTVPAPDTISKYGAEQEIDPFCPKLQAMLLSNINFPQGYHSENYFVFNTSFPSIGKTLKLGNEIYNVLGDIGKGAYARIVKASVKNRMCALKIEKPACKWEHYICKEIQQRVHSSLQSCFMDLKNTFIFNGGSILETEWAQYGNLLNITNQYKIATGKVLESTVVLHFSIELVDIIDYLHKCQIIHADIKPDNFVVRSLPSCNETRGCIQLIDFGRSIDMRLLPPGTQFTTIVKTEGFTCCEMRERKPWTYQTDLYGLAATFHCLIFNEYMTVDKKNNVWKLQKSLPRSVRNLWEPIFNCLLNIESSEVLPEMSVIKCMLDEALKSKDKYLLSQNYRALEHILKGK